VLTGADIDGADDAALAAQLRDVTVFARISPPQKLRIVDAFKRNGEVVAMTGDGVNDAPALKSAHIGIAMGGRGTDVAREAASIVLLDDDFGSIVRAVRVGRRIYDNLRKAAGFILAVHVPIAGLALLPVFSGWPLLLTPLLIALLELIIDPACSIVLEAEADERDVMGRPPRAASARLLSPALLAWAALQGAAAFAAVCVPVVIGERFGLREESLRTVVLLSLAAANVALVLVNRTFATTLRSALGLTNPTLWWGTALVAGIMGLVVGWPAARGYFGLDALPPRWLVAIGGVALALFVTLEIAKLAWRRALVR
jgi:Ca2+-transporting ATPase